jgi:hypothetical protein
LPNPYAIILKQITSQALAPSQSNRNFMPKYALSIDVFLLNLDIRIILLVVHVELVLQLIKVNLHHDFSLTFAIIVITKTKSTQSKHRQETVEHSRVDIVIFRVTAIRSRRVAKLVILVGLSWSMNMKVAGAKTLPVENREACVLDHDVVALLVALGEDTIVLRDPLHHMTEEARGGDGSHH